MPNEDKQQVVIMQDSYQPVEKSYWSLVKYGKSTWRHKWWVLGTTVFLGVAGLLVTKFAVNPSREKATAKFSYQLALSGGRFLDGERFNYTDIITLEYLNAVKASSDEYSSIDVEKMVNANAISVEINLVDEEKDADKTQTYTLTVKPKYFKNDTQMANFMRDVISYPEEKAKVAIDSFSLANKVIPEQFADQDFNQQIDYLVNQYDNVKGAYSSLVSSFPTSTILDEQSGLTLEEANINYSLNYADGSGTIFSTLNSRITLEGLTAIYDNDIETTVNKLKQRAERYKETLIENLNRRVVYSTQLETLMSVSTGSGESTSLGASIASVASQISSIDISNVSLVKTLSFYGYAPKNADVTTLTTETVVANYVYDESKDYCKDGVIYKLSVAPDQTDKMDECNAFGDLLKSYAEELTADIDVVNTYARYLYKEYNNKVNFYNAGIYTIEDHLSSLLIAAVAAVVGLLGSSLLLTAIDISKEKEAEAHPVTKKEEAPAESK